MIDLPAVVSADDPLCQPTRARLFALLGQVGRPAGTAELAGRLGLHPNGVRMHLDRLQRDGLLIREREQLSRGRPRDVWTIAPDARPGGRPASAYGDLSRWLARATGSGSRGLARIEAAGRQIGEEIGASEGGRGSGGLETALSRLGFAPEVKRRAGERVTICLRNCPYRDAVRENRPAICTLHKGVTRGLIDAVWPGAELAGFEPKSPDGGGCLIKLRGS
jgi:predicted ArsR family transcriptional regulator